VLKAAVLNVTIAGIQTLWGNPGTKNYGKHTHTSRKVGAAMYLQTPHYRPLAVGKKRLRAKESLARIQGGSKPRETLSRKRDHKKRGKGCKITAPVSNVGRGSKTEGGPCLPEKLGEKKKKGDQCCGQAKKKKAGPA